MTPTDLEVLRVKRGHVITAFRENLLVDAMRARTAAPGLNVRVEYLRDRQVIHFDPPMPGFDHPWKTRLVGRSVEVATGFVLEIEPTINRVPLSGDGSSAPPLLDLSADLYDEEGRSWICLRVKRKADRGEGADQLVAEDCIITQRAKVPGLSSGGVAEVDGYAYWPLAVLKRRQGQSGSFGRVVQSAFWNLGHRYNAVSKRHFFPAAGNI